MRTGQVVHVTGTGGSSHFASICDVTDTSQSVAPGAAHYVLMGTKTADTDGFVTGSGELTIPAVLGHGIYRVSLYGQLGSATPSSGYVQLFLLNSGDDSTLTQRIDHPQSMTETGQWRIASDLELNTGDTVQAMVYNQTDVTIGIAHGGAPYWRMTIEYVGPVDGVG